MHAIMVSYAACVMSGWSLEGPDNMACVRPHSPFSTPPVKFGFSMLTHLQVGVEHLQLFLHERHLCLSGAERNVEAGYLIARHLS